MTTVEKMTKLDNFGQPNTVTGNSLEKLETDDSFRVSVTAVFREKLEKVSITTIFGVFRPTQLL